MFFRGEARAEAGNCYKYFILNYLKIFVGIFLKNLLRGMHT